MFNFLNVRMASDISIATLEAKGQKRNSFKTLGEITSIQEVYIQATKFKWNRHSDVKSVQIYLLCPFSLKAPGYVHY